MDEDGLRPTTPDVSAEDERSILNTIGAALATQEGLLGLVGESAVEIDIADGRAAVRIRAILEAGRDIPSLVSAMTDAITQALRDADGVEVASVRVSVVRTMTRDAYGKQHCNAK